MADSEELLAEAKAMLRLREEKRTKLAGNDAPKSVDLPSQVTGGGTDFAELARLLESVKPEKAPLIQVSPAQPDTENIRAVQAYECDNCDCTFTEWRSGTARYHSGGELSEDDCIYTADEGSEENVWWCGDGCFHHDAGKAPSLSTYWECKHCGTLFPEDQRDDAEGCCS